MTAFFLVAALLVAIAAAFVLWPLLRGGGKGGRSDGTEVARFRRQRQDLDAEHQAGRLSEAAYTEARSVLERRLVDALAGTAAAQEPKGSARAITTAAVVVTLLLIVPAGLYVWHGTPDAFSPQVAVAEAQGGGAGEGSAGGGARQLTPAQVQKMIDDLRAALKKNPGDAGSWTMLARAHAYLRQFPEAVRAYTEAVSRNPRDARLLADLADAMAMANGQKLERALQIDPKDVKALALAGTLAFDQRQYAKAVQLWERAVAAAGNDPEFGDGLRNSLEEARKLAGMPAAAPATAGAKAGPVAGGSAFVRGRVQLSKELAAKVQPGDIVFVFARASQGPRMPLALLRREARELPFDFSLDESMAMTPEFTLGKAKQVTIHARVSHNGDAMPSAGDLEGSSAVVAVGSADVRVTIDHAIVK